jgi:hypothetical protein
MSDTYSSVKKVLTDHILRIDEEFDALMKQRAARNDELDRIGDQLNLLRKMRAEHSDALDLLDELQGNKGR